MACAQRRASPQYCGALSNEQYTLVTAVAALGRHELAGSALAATPLVQTVTDNGVDRGVTTDEPERLPALAS
jgi:hypothetical protein